MIRNLYLMAIALLLGLPAYAQPKLEVSVVVDAATAKEFGEADTRALVDKVFSDAAFIYEQELQIELKMVVLEIAADVPYDVLAEDLVEKMYDWRQRHTVHSQADATILLTKRTLVGKLIGYAHGVGGVCTKTAVGVVHLDRSDSGWLSGHTLAHELGHILGANHDGEKNGSCPAELPNAYMMSANINYSGTFSSCSANAIKTWVQNNGQCMIDKPTAPSTPPSTASSAGKSGGGSMDWLFLMLLLPLVALKRIRV